MAEAYERFAPQNGYAALAKDVVALLGLGPGARVLDVGCGPGAATVAAEEAVGPGGLVVGVEPSLPMLRRARARGVGSVVAGAAPGLPFPDRTFDAVVASLVLSHLQPFEAALDDLVRVVAPGGVLGATAWTEGEGGPNPVYRLWGEMAASLVGRDALGAAARTVVPHEAWLGHPARLTAALAAAGLDGVRLERRAYAAELPVLDYLAMLDLFTYGRFVRASVDPVRWEEARSALAETVRRRCPQPVRYTARYHLAVGRRAG